MLKEYTVSVDHSMIRNSYTTKLEQIYKRVYSAPDGYCPFYNDCKGGILLSECKFASDKALVGNYYGNNDGKTPKLVFVGLEGLRTPGVVQVIESTSTSAFNPHYKGVRYVTAYLLSGIAGEKLPENALKSTLIRYNKTMEQISLINCYKCAFSLKSQGLPHTQAMRDNCQRILFEEIEALDPDILIIQIKTNRPTNLEERINQYDHSADNCISGNTDTGAYSYKLPSGKPFILIWTYHGSGDPNPHKRAWVNDNRGGNVYIKETLNPVLNSVIKKYRGIIGT